MKTCDLLILNNNEVYDKLNFHFINKKFVIYWSHLSKYYTNHYLYIIDDTIEYQYISMNGMNGPTIKNIYHNDLLYFFGTFSVCYKFF